MGNYVSKFGLYEFLALLVPGTVFTQSLWYLLPYWEGSQVLSKLYQLSTEEYILGCIVVAFLMGLILHEAGTIWDGHFGYNLLYGNNPDRAWAEKKDSRHRWHVIEDDSIAKEAKKLCRRSLPGLNGNDYSRMFYYMLNTLEANGIAGKAEKMMIESELSRSLVLTSFFLLLAHIVERLRGKPALDLTYFTILGILIFLMKLFTRRKIRYEHFRIATIIRTFVIFKRSEVPKQENVLPKA